MTDKKITPVLLCILDGFGSREEQDSNAIYHAHMPNMDAMYEQYPHCKVGTDGLNVGLPDGQMGNSEVGHMNIGGGRVVMQNLPKIDDAIASGALAENPALIKHIDALKASGGVCHLMGLLSDGGVHSHMDHMLALANIISKAGVEVKIHAYLDGRDTPPQSAVHYVKILEQAVLKMPRVSVATLCGRYYAMDRDARWERVQLGYDAMISAVGARHADASDSVEASYADGKNDEFVLPIIVDDYAGVNDGDGLLMANFRSDRAREILQCLVEESFDGFNRSKVIKWSAKLGMVEYSDHLNQYHDVMFSAEKLTNTLGSVVADAGLKQLRCAETEKYAHVTFFFNGGAEEVFEGETRELVPSPDVATYDLQPEMAAEELTDNLVEAIEAECYDLIVVNYANMDMVGHTGVMEAAVKAAETLDVCVERVKNAVLEHGGVMLVTADHGNAEMMVDPDTGAPHTAHTLFNVPFIVVGAEKDSKIHNGRLCDIAPTVLALMGLQQPAEMTGRSLITQ
jgi:2,3-bisphosphoglycerate-independent phosphoglycerate mutase